MTKKKKIFLNIVIITIGLIGLWLVTSHIAHFEFPEYFYNANPDIKTYVGTNVVSAWADFSFFYIPNSYNFFNMVYFVWNCKYFFTSKTE